MSSPSSTLVSEKKKIARPYRRQDESSSLQRTVAPKRNARR
jgi:hypothetical protein